MLNAEPPAKTRPSHLTSDIRNGLYIGYPSRIARSNATGQTLGIHRRWQVLYLSDGKVFEIL